MSFWIDQLNDSIANYKGDSRVLAHAIGIFMIGQRFGWRHVRLQIDRKTWRQYERVLGVQFTEEMPEYGVDSWRSIALHNWSRSGRGFWPCVRGEVPGVRTPDVADRFGRIKLASFGLTAEAPEQGEASAV